MFQVMWMGSGMAPVMFPGVPHYISRMGMGIGPPPAMPSIHNPLHLQNQPVMCQTPVLNPVVNYQDQMHGSGFYEQYARYMRLHHMQTASQVSSCFLFLEEFYWFDVAICEKLLVAIRVLLLSLGHIAVWYKTI
jgi:phytochrome-interacting factor 4